MGSTGPALSRAEVGSNGPAPSGGGLPDRSGPAPRGDFVLLSFLREMSVAARALLKRPGFAAAVIVTLALGIGANSAIFSLVNGVLLAPLPYPEPERLVRIVQKNSPTNWWSLSAVDFQAIHEQQTSFAAVAALMTRDVTLTGGERPEWIRAGFASADLLRTLDVRVAEGRGFQIGEDGPDAAAVVVLGHAFAERTFGNDVAAALGRTVTIDGGGYSVIGVLPPGLTRLAGHRADLWPILRSETPTRRGPFFLYVVGRLRSEASMEIARAELAEVSERIFPLWADGFQDESARLTPMPLRDALLGDVGGSLRVAFAAVLLVLLVAIANVANLVLARATDRSQETAVRAALGAGRGQLARWLLAESLVLSVVGGIAGLALAQIGVLAYRSSGAPLPRLAEVRVDAATLVFTAAVALITALVLAIVPLISGAAGDLTSALRRTRATNDRRTRALRGGLIVAEFALTLPLLVAAGLLMTSLAQLQRVDPGFDPRGVVAAQIRLPSASYPDGGATLAFWEEAVAMARSLPGVTDVGLTAGLPPDSPTWFNNFDLIDDPVEPGQPQPVSAWLVAGEGFLRALRIPLLEGRLFEPGDVASGVPVVVVSRAWAERFFPGESAVGRTMISGGCTQCTPTEIIGVIGDVKFEGLAGGGEAVFESARQVLLRSMYLVVRSEGEPTAVVRPLQAGLRQIDADLPLANVTTLRDKVHASIAQPRHWATLLGIFATVAIALAAVGIFGVLSYFVGQQTREIGVRMALGAGPAQVVRDVVRRGTALALSGVAVGAVLSLFATRWLESMLFRVRPTDPVTLIGVSALLVVVAVAACYLPGRRAAGVDPVDAITGD